MKISICIPQYNRIEYLLKSLSVIEQQCYDNIEIVISDDCSSDHTIEAITNLSTHYKYPIVFDSNQINKGYDYNFRKSIAMSSGDYVLVLGNDDTLNGVEAISKLVNIIEKNNYPDVGFCNMLEERTGNQLIKRAWGSSVIGSGADIALNHYSCFSFVGGLIFKRSVFIQHNTDKYDGSVFVQIYLAVLMISKGYTLFSIDYPLVIKDILIDGKFRHSYRDRIAKKWKDYKIVDGGLHAVIMVLVAALEDAQSLTQKRLFYIFKRIYGITFPHWILDYKSNHALPEAVGLTVGLLPTKNQDFKLLNIINKIRLLLIYITRATLAFITPVFIFNQLKHKLYAFLKNKK